MRKGLTFLFLILASLLNAHQGFVENQGQWPKEVLFAVDIHEGRLFIQSNGYRVHQWDLSGMHHADPTYEVNSEDIRFKGHVFEVQWQGNRRVPQSMGSQCLSARSNFYLGNDSVSWARNCRSFKEVIQYNVYPGIDLVWKKDGHGHVKYEWHIQANASPNQIGWRFIGLDDVQAHGERLNIRHSLGQMTDEISDCFIKKDHQWLKWDGPIHYQRNAKGVFSFQGGIPKGHPFIIDPQLIFSTYSGSSSDNFGYTATYDQWGYLYSGSSAFGQGYPTTLGAYQTTWAGGDGSGSLAGTDIALTKYSLDGTQLIWSTFIGGDRDELPHSLVVNDQDELLFYGSTGSYNFPVTADAYDTTFNAGTSFTPQGIGTTYAFGSDVILGRLSDNGSELLSSTYFGGSGNDGVNTAVGLKFNYADEFRGEIDIAPSGQVVIVGTTNSADFPTTMAGSGLLQDAFVSVWDSEMSTLVWSKKWGGVDDESGCSVAFDDNGIIWVCGGTQSNDLVMSSSALQPNFGGGNGDGWLLKLSPTGSQLAASYWGGAVYDQLYFIDTDEFGFPYVYGQSLATGNTWVNNVGWSQPNSGMYVGKWNESLTQVEWSTVFGSGGGLPNLSPAAFLVDVCGQIYLSGWGGSVNQSSNPSVGNTQGLWLSNDAFQSTTNGSDFYLLVMDQSANFPVYGTYFGGGVSAEHVDGGTSRFDRKGIIYQSVCAGCGSHDDFPIYPSNAWSPTNGSSNCNNGVFKFDFELPLTYVNALFPEEICLGESVSFNADLQQVSDIQWFFEPSNEVISNEANFDFVFQDTGWFFVQAIATDSMSCNGIDSSGHWIHVRGPQNQTLPLLQLCFGDTTMVGILDPLPNASYHWVNGEGVLNDSVYWSPYAAMISEELVLLQQGGFCVDTIRQSIQVTQLTLGTTEDVALCNPQIVDLLVEVQPANVALTWSTDAEMQVVVGNGSTLNWMADSSITLYIQGNLENCFQNDSIIIQVLNVASSVFETQTWCAWDTIALSVPNPLTQCTYEWLSNGQIISSLDSSAVWVTPIQSAWYYVTTSIPGCSILDSVFVATSDLNWNEVNLVTSAAFIGVGDEVMVECIPLGLTYQWSPLSSLASSINNTATFVLNEDTWVGVEVNDGECRGADSVFIKVESVLCKEPFLFVPNVFSPNGDGLHDDIGVQSSLSMTGNWMIRDRWGKEVFKTNQLDARWDGNFQGKPAEPGVYHYYLMVQCLNGEVWEKEGNITLIRIP